MVWLLGLSGCALGLIIFSKKHMHKIGPVYAYRLLFISDIINMIQMYDSYTNQLTGISPNSLNNIVCKIATYINYFSINLSPSLIVYISVEKLVSIRYPAKRFILRKKKNQILFFILILLLNMCIYSPALFMYDSQFIEIESFNMTFHKSVCSYSSSTSQQVLSTIYLINKVIIPFVMMLLCSILLTISVFKLAQRIIQNFQTKMASVKNRKYLREIRLTITSLLLNIIYLVLNAPFAVFMNSPDYYSIDLFSFSVVINIFYFSYSVNFYLIFISNKLTQKEFKRIFL